MQSHDAQTRGGKPRASSRDMRAELEAWREARAARSDPRITKAKIDVMPSKVDFASSKVDKENTLRKPENTPRKPESIPNTPRKPESTPKKADKVPQTSTPGLASPAGQECRALSTPGASLRTTEEAAERRRQELEAYLQAKQAAKAVRTKRSAKKPVLKGLPLSEVCPNRQQTSPPSSSSPSLPRHEPSSPAPASEDEVQQKLLTRLQKAGGGEAEKALMNSDSPAVEPEEEEEDIHRQHVELLERMSLLQEEAGKVALADTLERPRLEQDLQERFQAAMHELQDLSEREARHGADSWRQRVKKHKISWPPQTDLDVEDFLSRAHDLATFWFFEVRDRIKLALPNFKPRRLEVVPER